MCSRIKARTNLVPGAQSIYYMKVTASRPNKEGDERISMRTLYVSKKHLRRKYLVNILLRVDPKAFI